MSNERPKVLVDAKALYDVLMALNGPPHLMRELQVTKGALFPDNPITVLTNSYNEAVQNAAAEP